jgi:hypothetical protein
MWASQNRQMAYCSMCPRHKKGDKLQCNNCRQISPLNVHYKVLTNILVLHFGRHWCGFGKGQFATDNLMMLRCIFEEVYKLNLDLHLMFVYFKQMYDSLFMCI